MLLVLLLLLLLLLPVFKQPIAPVIQRRHALPCAALPQGISSKHHVNRKHTSCKAQSEARRAAVEQRRSPA